ncbi:TIGR04255 family protein [Methylomonas koyamae]|uniref:TIGR04255 family protein n=1 Tax=Methylomonas koyamae TaxID=702114 RepID=UPI002872B32D|nr:TIGR04255 family protein [Methylomonas koyamae]WNB74834.1 TIGR04255 family protein [Methylomonas koyamae]
MGAPLKTPPVYLTLAQVRFNPILKLLDFLPSIQEGFRQAGYPDFEHQPIISIQLIANEGQPPTPSTVQQERFLFGNVEKTHVFILDSQSLTLQSTNYGQFETFSACFLTGLNIVNSAVKLAFTERIGLRYLDRVMPQPEEIIEQYLVEQVQGLNSRLGGRQLYSYTEAMNEIGNIKLLSRVAIQDGPLAFPPDIQPGNMRIIERFVTYVGISAILDNDGFVECREVFSAETVERHLVTIHDVIRNAFNMTATQYAFTAWDK